MAVAEIRTFARRHTRRAAALARVAIAISAAITFGIALATPLQAQVSGASQPPAKRPATAPQPAKKAGAAAPAVPMPVRRVILYKTGVGYFEHLGRIRDSQTVVINFTSGQLDDVLNSLTTLDLDGGRVAAVDYNSEETLARRLNALRLPIGEQTTRAQFLTALRGATLEVRTATATVTGRLLSVERIDRRSDGATTQVDALSLVSTDGVLRTIPLDAGVSVRIVDAGLNQDVGKYLSLVASARDQDLRQLTITTAGKGARDLFVSYLSEVPVWKTTYRLILPTAAETRKPLLQGWAIVDNTVGQDWENVELSLVAGAPQSFIQQISRPYYVQRPIVPLPASVQLSPQTHQGAIGVAGPGSLTGTVLDGRGSAVANVTIGITTDGGPPLAATTDPAGRFHVAGLAAGTYEVTFTRIGFGAVTRSGVEVSGGMETVLNVTLEAMALSLTAMTTSEDMPMPMAPFATTGVAGGGAGRGGRGGAAANPSPIARQETARSAQQAQADAAQLGDLFEYKIKDPVTIRKNQSALLPILSGDVVAERVSLWNATSGHARPLRAAWLTNSTGLTLDGGSFTVIEGEVFAGEGLMDPLKPGERRLLSYATDLGLQVDGKTDGVPTRSTEVHLSRGVLMQRTEDGVRETYTARNEDVDPRVLVIEHPVKTGWSLTGTAPPIETTEAWYRFRMDVAPKTTVTFTVQETHPVATSIAISSITDQQIAFFSSQRALTPAIESQLREVITRKAEIARIAADMTTHQNQITAIGTDQARVRQNMQALKGSPEERQLLQRYVKQLGDQETQLDTLRAELQALTVQRAAAQADLDKFIDGMTG